MPFPLLRQVHAICQMQVICCIVALATATSLLAQGNNFGQGNQQAFAFPGQGQGQGQGQGALFGPQQGPGGGANADFDSLIDLLMSTVAPDSWSENGGGEAEVRPYFNGVFVDAQGTLQRAKATAATHLTTLQREVGHLVKGKPPASGDVRRQVALRCVSLVRMEREIARRKAASESFDPAMLTLAGLQRVQYVFTFPATEDQPGDLVLAGPAGDWYIDDQRAILAKETSEPIVRLDDLLTLLRRAWRGGSAFGCTIDPRPEALAETQTYLTSTSTKPIRPSKRRDWLEGLRSRVGKQDIRFMAIDPTSRPAQVIITADHHMKLIGMGLAEGVPGVESYLDTIKIPPGGSAPPTGVLRWWFAMNYASVKQSESGDAFEIVGPGAKVMSENQLLTERGERIPTGQSDELTQQFAASFTANFDALCQKYPIYGELRNIFDLSLVMAMIRERDLAKLAGWQPTLLLDEQQLALPRYAPPKTVDTVVNHKVIRRKHIVAGVSGGVWSDASTVLSDRLQAAGDEYSPLTRHDGALPHNLAPTTWWWDLEE